MSIRTAFAFDPADNEEKRLKKNTIFFVASSCCIAGLVWSAMYAFVFGLGLTSALPLVFVIIVGIALLTSHITKRISYVVYAQIVCIIYFTAFIQWSIGGIFDSGFLLAWAFCGPIVALIFFSLRKATIWFSLYLLNIVITVVFRDFFMSRGQEVLPKTQAIFFLMNVGIASAVVFMFAGYFVSSANKERLRAEALLLNILPKKIAPILKSGRTIADYHDSVSVLFADIVGSTPLFSKLDPAIAVDRINEVFSLFDRLVANHGLEKIRTIGDNYMVAAGVPSDMKNHAVAICSLALDMVEGAKSLPQRDGERFGFRLGINSGPVVAGVIGRLKFQYDLWGDTVNIASRMESSGEIGRVQISDLTYQLVKDAFLCECRGEIPIKGKGQMLTWFLVRKKSQQL